MPHSHLPVMHLIRQVEIRRANREARDMRPRWLQQLIDLAADLFDPVADVARVGYHCQLTESGWQIDMFLGQVEDVGGRDDGVQREISFHFDVAGALRLFDEVLGIRWSAWPGSALADEDDEDELEPEAPRDSSLCITGTVQGNPLKMQVFAIPPDNMGPGLRRFPNGDCSPI